MSAIIKFENVSFSYGRTIIFKNLNFEIYEQDFSILVGKNGCGKTTLIKILAGLLPYEGNIYINNTILNKETKFSIRKEIGFILENMSDFFVCDTVIDEITFSMENLNYEEDLIEKNVIEISKILNIEHLLKKSIKVLSGGEKQLVALASILVVKPKILVIDDGLSSLDNYEKENILKILKKLNNEENLTILLSTNEFENAYDCNKVIIINDKQTIIKNNIFEIFEDNELVKKMKIQLPFMVDLSIKLKHYNLVDEIELDIKKLVNKLWM